MSWLLAFFFLPNSFAQQGQGFPATGQQPGYQQQFQQQGAFPPNNFPQQNYGNPPNQGGYPQPGQYPQPSQPYYPPSGAPGQPQPWNGQPQYPPPAGFQQPSQPSYPTTVTDDAAPAAEARPEEALDPFDSGRRDPFKLPNYIIDKLKIKNAINGSSGPKEVFEKDPLKRWPLEKYLLVGISWDVHSPKAIILDGAGDIHVLGLKRKLGVLGAVLIRIEEGQVVFNEKGKIKTLNLKK